MKKIILTAASLIAFTAAANAGSLPCNPATGNWVNAAHTTCPPLGSGADQSRIGKLVAEYRARHHKEDSWLDDDKS